MSNNRPTPKLYPPQHVGVTVTYVYRDGKRETVTLVNQSMIGVIVLVRDILKTDNYCEGATLNLKWNGIDQTINILRDV